MLDDYKVKEIRIESRSAADVVTVILTGIKFNQKELPFDFSYQFVATDDEKVRLDYLVHRAEYNLGNVLKRQS